MVNFKNHINKMKEIKAGDRFYLYDGHIGRLLCITEREFLFIKKWKFFSQIHDSNTMELMSASDPSALSLGEKLEEIAVSDNLGEESLLSIGLKNSSVYGLNSLWLNIVHACNMSCKYCFVDNGKYGNTSGYMERDTAIRAVEKWLNNLDSRQTVFNVIFFGGEPLLNWELIEYIVDKVEIEVEKRKKHCRYYLTTNATIINEKILDLIKNHDFVFSISIDGLEYIHNYNRPLANSNDSYMIIRKNIESFLCAAPKTIANMVVCREDIPFIVESVKELWQMGFKAVKVVLSMEREVHLTFDELLEYKEQMEQLANDTYENIIKGDRHVVENFIEIFSSLSNRKNCGGCALYNDRVMVVAPDGEEFKCYKQISANMREQEHRFMEKCDNCWAVSLCDEGCPLDHKIFTDDFYKRSEELCNRSKCLYNVALKLYIRFSEVGADKLKKYFLWRHSNDVK